MARRLRTAAALPLWLKVLVGGAVLAFVWSPFLAMVLRMSGVNQQLAPSGSPLSSPLAPAGDAGAVNQTTVP